ncbi:MAG: Mut7-C RNAse domain-containing protein [Chloroflexota bacterium]
MSTVTVRFYAQLNDFLPRERREVAFTHSFEEAPSIKDLIESLGVPHTEVRLILINGAAVDFTYHIQDGDQINVYPSVFGSDSTPLTDLRLQPQFTSEIRFILDVHLGKLAAYLRMLGFDTLYRNDYDDPELALVSNVEDRVLLTRDLGLLKRSLVTHGYFVRNTDPGKQLTEVLRQFKLFGLSHLFHRCLQCNTVLESIDKELIGDRLPSRTKLYFHEFRICRSCDKIFWQGSHYQKMSQFIERVLADEAAP